MIPQSLPRREFIKALALTGAGAALGQSALAQPAAGAAPRRNIKLGLDNFAVRAMKWKADALMDYAAALKTDSLFITDLGPFESFEDNYLRDVRRKAADK